MEEEEGGGAGFDGGVGGARDGSAGVLEAAVLLEVCACRGADTEVGVPDASAALGGGGDVPLDYYGAWCWATRFPHEIGDFDSAAVSWVTNFPDGSWIGLVLEVGASAHDDAVEFAHNANIRWDIDGIGNNVCAFVEETHIA